MALKHVKNKITATKKTGKVTKAMESVSAVKMRKSQERALGGRPYVRTALSILTELVGSAGDVRHPLAETNASSRTLLVIVTSDKGLAGSVNSAVLKHAEAFLRDGADVDAVCVGRKAVDFARRNNVPVIGEYTNVGDDVVLADIRDMVTHAITGYQNNSYGSVYVIYQNFISTFEQAPITRQLLPLDSDELRELAAGIIPASGRYSDTARIESSGLAHDIEPSADAVLDTLLPQLISIILYHALLESKASEHSARMVAMKNATDKAKELVKALTIEYNKERQAAITAEVSEITACAEAMK